MFQPTAVALSSFEYETSDLEEGHSTSITHSLFFYNFPKTFLPTESGKDDSTVYKKRQGSVTVFTIISSHNIFNVNKNPLRQTDPF